MATIINKSQMEAIVRNLDIVAAMEEGFIAYSNGKTVVPPVGELLFDEPKGDVHIKYGYIRNDDFYVIKIASGFYDNPKLGLPSSQGMMLVFNQKTGQAVAVLLDEGYLTDIRTAAAGIRSATRIGATRGIRPSIRCVGVTTRRIRASAVVGRICAATGGVGAAAIGRVSAGVRIATRRRVCTAAAGVRAAARYVAATIGRRDRSAVTFGDVPVQVRNIVITASRRIRRGTDHNPLATASTAGSAPAALMPAKHPLKERRFAHDHHLRLCLRLRSLHGYGLLRLSLTCWR